MLKVLNTLDHSAIGNVDYLPQYNESVYIEAYQSKQVFIGILEDINVEGDELFFVKITGAAADEGSLINVTISDNDRKLIVDPKIVLFIDRK